MYLKGDAILFAMVRNPIDLALSLSPLKAHTKNSQRGPHVCMKSALSYEKCANISYMH